MEQFQIGCLLKMITDKIKMRADADLAQQGLTLTQSRVLGYLDRSGGQATQKEIEGFLQVSHPTVAGVIGRMEQKGFVSCRACGNVVQCPNCDISMTYHKAEQRLRCHFCGASAPLPMTRPAAVMMPTACGCGVAGRSSWTR